MILVRYADAELLFLFPQLSPSPTRSVIHSRFTDHSTLVHFSINTVLNAIGVKRIVILIHLVKVV
jgi:hypothetical protein